ncbi:unnamed protein product [Adineta ricciae]|uniref:Uncharacterized protein n=1 Tax=Adineta ricciae TaxID=249248 RepID=A0A814SGJ6_ADIRI|nr:unnamed protein product [Adineta ricciae]
MNSRNVYFFHQNVVNGLKISLLTIDRSISPFQLSIARAFLISNMNFTINADSIVFCILYISGSGTCLFIKEQSKIGFLCTTWPTRIQIKDAW